MQISFSREVMIEPGDTFFAFTDGLTDTENTTGETFSEKGCDPIVWFGSDLVFYIDQIHKQLDAFSAGTQQIDDITMLAVKRRNK